MAMSWAQRLKLIFDIDNETSEKCQGSVRIIACAEDPAAIKQILDHLASKETSAEQATLPSAGHRPSLRCLTRSTKEKSVCQGR